MLMGGSIFVRHGHKRAKTASRRLSESPKLQRVASKAAIPLARMQHLAVESKQKADKEDVATPAASPWGAIALKAAAVKDTESTGAKQRWAKVASQARAPRGTVSRTVRQALADAASLNANQPNSGPSLDPELMKALLEKMTKMMSKLDDIDTISNRSGGSHTDANDCTNGDALDEMISTS